MLAGIPGVERLTLRRIGHGGADDEIGRWHGFLPRLVRSLRNITQRQHQTQYPALPPRQMSASPPPALLLIQPQIALISPGERTERRAMGRANTRRRRDLRTVR